MRMTVLAAVSRFPHPDIVPRLTVPPAIVQKIRANPSFSPQVMIGIAVNLREEKVARVESSRRCGAWLSPVMSIHDQELYENCRPTFWIVAFA